MSIERSPSGELLCSFCGKSRTEVAHVIAGSSAIICDECTRLAVEILQDEAISSTYAVTRSIAPTRPEQT